MCRQVLGMDVKPYTPDFKTAFDHFCIHPGGKAVISEVGSQLKLGKEQCMPMLVPFERYGNTSSSSTWCAAANGSSMLFSAPTGRWMFENNAACRSV